MKRRVVHAIRDGRLCYVIQLRRWWYLTWLDESRRTYTSRAAAIAVMVARNNG